MLLWLPLGALLERLRVPAWLTGAVGWSISDADMKEIDAIFAKHKVVSSPDSWLES